MLLIVDNHDSFTFNLVDLLRQIGTEMEVVSVEALNLDDVERFSHILLSPGPDVPRAYPNLFAMLERYHQSKSILGVCLGHQTLCEFFGGTLYNLNDVRHGQQRVLRQIRPNPIFQELPAQFRVGLYHSWGILQKSLENTPLVATAECEQGVLMAFRHQSLPIYGVQFHPESFITEYGRELLTNWLSSPITKEEL